LVVTAASLPRWRAVLTLLSLERCTPLFAELGLPARLATEPAGLLAAARAAVEALHHPTDRAGSDASVAEARRILGEVFRHLAADYDRATAGALGIWLGRHVLSEAARAAFTTWRELLRRLCCLVSWDDLTVPTSLNSVTMLRICQAVHRYLAPEPLAVLRHLLRQVRSLPESPWEEWLERQTRHKACGPHHLGAVAQALDLATGLGADARTARAWHDLLATTSVPERSDLFGWARRQASALSVPHEVLDHEPFREPPERAPAPPTS
jgi:hypothetical protein